MGRALAEVLVPFVLPFAGYALLVALGRHYPSVTAAWTTGRLARLVVIGLALAVSTLLLLGLFGPRAHGDYVPAHLEDGVLVPGRLR